MKGKDTHITGTPTPKDFIMQWKKTDVKKKKKAIKGRRAPGWFS